MGVGSQRHAPAALSLDKRPRANYTEGWVGFRSALTHFHYISCHSHQHSLTKGRASRAAAWGVMTSLNDS